MLAGCTALITTLPNHDDPCLKISHAIRKLRESFQSKLINIIHNIFFDTLTQILPQGARTRAYSATTAKL